jgi:hypothetical protein
MHVVDNVAKSFYYGAPYMLRKIGWPMKRKEVLLAAPQPARLFESTRKTEPIKCEVLYFKQ